MFKTYYQLTKPGIIRGNAIPAIAGFLLACHGTLRYWLLVQTLIGISLVIASGCVFNNYLDRDIDKKMTRTRHRALAEGRVSTFQALSYATVLGILGFAVLAHYTNSRTVLLGLIGIVFYVIVYGYAKRTSVHGTLVGSISGALPPVAGYVAVSDSFNGAALILFLILVFWQMPHFYAISIYRRKEYAAAGIPVLSVKKGVAVTKRDMIAYIILFGFAACSLALFRYTGAIYFVTALLLTIIWLYVGVRGLRTTKNEDRWAKKMFGISLLVLTLLCVAIGVSGILA